MPLGDRTGPLGQGPLTGRGLGWCGVGLRRGFGLRKGLCRFFGWEQPQTKEEQKQNLAEYRRKLEEELENTIKLEEELK